MKDINTWVNCVAMMNSMGFTFEINSSRVLLKKDIGDTFFEAQESFTNVDALQGYLEGYYQALYRYNLVNK